MKLLLDYPARSSNINTVVHHFGLDQNVWIVSFKGVWIGGLEHMRARSMIQTLHFDSQPNVCCVSANQSKTNT